MKFENFLGVIPPVPIHEFFFLIAQSPSYIHMSPVGLITKSATFKASEKLKNFFITLSSCTSKAKHLYNNILQDKKKISLNKNENV